MNDNDSKEGIEQASVVYGLITNLLVALMAMLKRNVAAMAILATVKVLIEDLYTDYQASERYGDGMQESNDRYLEEIDRMSTQVSEYRTLFTDTQREALKYRDKLSAELRANRVLTDANAALSNSESPSTVLVLRLFPGEGKPKCGTKITSIKAYRRLCTIGLKEAKESVERVMGRVYSSSEMRDVDRTPCECQMQLFQPDGDVAVAMATLTEHFEVKIESMSLATWAEYTIHVDHEASMAS